jgi:hypothetical protein
MIGMDGDNMGLLNRYIYHKLIKNVESKIELIENSLKLNPTPEERKIREERLENLKEVRRGFQQQIEIDQANEDIGERTE